MFDAARNSPFKGPLTVANCASGAAAPAGADSCEFGSTKYFLLCGLGGIISCGTYGDENFTIILLLCDQITLLYNEEWKKNIHSMLCCSRCLCFIDILDFFQRNWSKIFLRSGSTHTLLTPLDLVKCRLQVDQAKYKNLFTGFKLTYKEDGARGLAKGNGSLMPFYRQNNVFLLIEFSWKIFLVFVFGYRLGPNCLRLLSPRFVQIRFVRMVQSLLLRLVGRRKDLPLPYQFVFGRISLSWILRWYRIVTNGSR